MKASDLFVRCLERGGVRTIFGVPGEENADMMMSLLDSSIEFVICHHEQGAAFMAEVYGRLTGKPGVCLATLGPGATNLVTGVANANFDHAPIVAITGQGSTRRLHKQSHQNMDVVSMFRPITKWNSSVRGAGNIPETVERAVGLLGQAEAPIVLAGNGCIRTRASRELNTFVEKTGIYAANTFMGKGALSADNPRCLYAAGLGSRDHVTEAFERADLVLCVGYDMIEWPPDRWNVGRDKRIIHIDFEPAEADDHYQVDVEVVGDLASGLAAINARLGPEHRKPTALFQHLRDHMTADLHEHDQDDSFPMKPQRILSELRAALRAEDILISDVGAHKMWVARHYPVHQPGTCIISNGFCSMGIAVPGAISAKRALPERRVVGLVGDGGFLMNVQELATAVHYGIPATTLVWEDGAYGLIAWKQQARYGKTSHVEFANPDLVRVSEAFGCQGIRVGSAAELGPALERAFEETTRPSVVVVAVDYTENMKLTQRLGELISH